MIPATQCRCALSALLKNAESVTRREGTRRLSKMSVTGPNAGIIIIGDEILKGQTRVSEITVLNKGMLFLLSLLQA